MSKIKKIIMSILIVSILSVLFIIPVSAAELPNLNECNQFIDYYGYLNGTQDNIHVQYNNGLSKSVPFTNGKPFKIYYTRMQFPDNNSDSFYKYVTYNSGFLIFEFSFYVKLENSYEGLGDFSNLQTKLVFMDGTEDNFYSGTVPRYNYTTSYNYKFNEGPTKQTVNVKLTYDLSKMPHNGYNQFRIEMTFNNPNMDGYRQVVFNYMNVYYLTTYEQNNSADTIINGIGGIVEDSTDDITGSIQDSTNDITGAIGDSTNDITGSIDDSTDKITGSVEDSANTIVDGYENAQQQEKDEANTQGNDSVNGIIEVMPNQTQGFDNALGSFATALSTTSTNAKWKLPAIYIPAIDGVTPRINLTSEQDIDLGNSITELIPENILSLIRYLGTAALILYCAKELWHWVSYAMSLRKGEN